MTGAQVQLYGAGQAGSGSAAAPIGAPVTTNASTGAFTMNYSCPAAPGDQVYLIATGGNTGVGANASLELMSALGTCSSLGASVVVNEVTTVASAYALSPFVTTA